MAQQSVATVVTNLRKEMARLDREMASLLLDGGNTSLRHAYEAEARRTMIAKTIQRLGGKP